MPPELALPLQALGHQAVLVADTELREFDDGELVRRLPDVECDCLFTLDLYRQTETWAKVYTALAEGSGRVLRIRPTRRQGIGGPILIAHLMTYLVSAYDKWGQWLASGEIRLIDLGRGATTSVSREEKPKRGPRAYTAYTAQEVAGLMQQQLGYGPEPRIHERQRTRRGRAPN